MSERIGLQLAPGLVELVSGGPPTEMAVVVRNDSSVVDQFVLRVDGLEPDWYSLSETLISLFPGEQATARLELHVPDNATAGARSFGVVATSRDDPSQSTAVFGACDVRVAPGSSTTIEMLVSPEHRQVRGRGTATYALRLVNHRGEDMTGLDLLATDPSQQLEVRVEPDHLDLPAGAEATAVVHARPRRGLLFGRPRSSSFSVALVPAGEPGSRPWAAAKATLAQLPLLPVLAFLPVAAARRLPLLVGGLVALALLLWFLAGPGRQSGIRPPTPGVPTPLAMASPSPPTGPIAAGPSAAANQTEGPPRITHFGLGQPNDLAPDFVPLAWQIQNADSIQLTRHADDAADSTRPPKEVEHTRFVMHAANKAGPVEQTFNLYVIRPPRIETFELEATPAGDQVHVTYVTAGADTIEINGVQVPGPGGSVDLPAQSQYELRAVNPVGEASRSLIAPGPPSPTPTQTPTRTATPTATQRPVPSATPTPRPTPTPEPPTETPTPVPPTDTPTPVEPTDTPTLTPRPTPRPQTPPTNTPTRAPTLTPTPTEEPPTDTPTPTVTPTPTLTATPTVTSTVPIDQGETRFGIAEGFRNTGTMADTDANWERIVLSWQAIQPEGASDFRLGQTITNAQIQGEINRGVKLAGLLQFTPRWAQAKPDQGQRSPPRNLDLPYDDPNNYWGQFVYETVKFYAGRIDEWVIWNEPEFKPDDAGAGNSTTWLGTDAEFAQLLKVAYLAAKKANPNSIVSFPGVSYWVDRNNGRAQFYDRLLQILKSDPDAARFGFYHDAASLNLYRTPDDMLRTFGIYRDIQNKHGIDKPIWLTESNAMPIDDSKLGKCDHAGDPIKTTMQQQAAFAVQAFAMAAAAGYTRIGFYQMIDDDPCTQPAVWGVVRDDGSKRPVEDSLRTAIGAYLGFLHAVFAPVPRLERLWSAWPEDPSSYTPNWEVYQVTLDKPNNLRVSVLWNGDGATEGTPALLANLGPEPPGGLVVRIPKRGNSAHAIDKFGQNYPYFQEQNGYWVVYLPPATAYFKGDPPGYHYIGGDPVLILEDGVKEGEPVDPPEILTAAAPSAEGQPATTGGGADFRLGVDPADGQTIQQGDAADYTIVTQPLNGFSGPISLRIVAWSTQRFPQQKPGDTLPLHVSLPDTVTAGRPAVVHIETTAEDDVGIYYLVLEASGKGVTKEAQIALVVDPPSLQ